MEQGVSRHEAVSIARREFGDVSLIEEVSHEISQRPFESIWADLRRGLRQLRGSPAITLTVVITLAFGIGANAAIYTLVYGLLMRPLPIPEAKMLYRVGNTNDCCTINGFASHDGNISLFSYDLYKHLQRRTQGFEQLAAMQAGSSLVSVRQDGRPAKAEISEFVSGNYFETFRLKASLGRLLTDADDTPDATPAAVLSYDAWQSKYSGDPAVVGETFYVQGRPLTLIGVAPPGFFGDRISSDPPDLWIPLSGESYIRRKNSILNQPDENWLYILGRVKAETSIQSSQEVLSSSVRQWLTTQDAFLRQGGAARISSQHVVLVSGSAGIQNLQQTTSKKLYVLMFISGLLLLVACANIANLLLTRGVIRHAETSARIALGAAKGRLFQQMLIGNILLGLLGGFAGLMVSYFGARLILTMIFPDSVHMPIQTSPSVPTLTFAFLLSLLTGIAFGITPAWIFSRGRMTKVFEGTFSQQRFRLSLSQRGLIAFQAALSLILLVGAGLFMRSLENIEHQNFGFQTPNRFVLHLDPGNAQYTPERLESLYQTLQERFGSLPGVQNIGLALYSPLEGNNWSLGVFVQGRPRGGMSTDIGSSFDRVSPHFFEAVGQHFISGRGFTDQDTSASPMVAVVNQAFANKFFPKENPIGKHFGNWSPQYADAFEIVGVVADAKYTSPREPVRPMFFRPLSQWKRDLVKPNWATFESWSMYIDSVTLSFSRKPPQDLSRMVQETLASIDPNLTVISFSSFDYQISRNFMQERLMGRLTLLFGLLALILASVGIYSIASYQFARRANRAENCAEPHVNRPAVIWLVLRGVLIEAGLGLVFGVAIALLIARHIKDQFYGIRPDDPLSMALAVGAFMTAAIAAGLIVVLRAKAMGSSKVLRID